MKLSWVIYVLVGAGLLCQTWLAYSIVGILPGYPGSCYWFTIPHLVLLLLLATVVALDAVCRIRSTFVAVLTCVTCLLPTWYFAGFHWPGSNDGPGMAWVFGVGFASLWNTVIGLFLICIARRKNRSGI